MLPAPGRQQRLGLRHLCEQRHADRIGSGARADKNVNDISMKRLPAFSLLLLAATLPAAAHPVDALVNQRQVKQSARIAQGCTPAR